MSTAILWGVLSYSLLTLTAVVSLAVKLALLFRDRGVLRTELAASERRAVDATKTAKDAEAMAARYRSEIEVLRAEITRADSHLGVDGVADRLKLLLSGKVSENGENDGGGGGAVSSAPGAVDKPGVV